MCYSSTVKKYLTVFSLSLQDAFSERGEAFIWVILDFLGPLMMLFVFLAIYQGGEQEIAGFNLSQMLTYYLGVMIINAVATAHSDWDLFRLIAQGELSNFLIKPLGVFSTQLLGNVSWKILKGAFLCPFLIIIFFFFRRFLTFSLTPPLVLGLVVSLALAYFLYFLNSFILGSLTLFFEDPSNFINLNEMLRTLFSGAWLPLVFFPPFIQRLAAFLPYRLLYDFPLKVMTGKISFTDLLWGLAWQVFWIVALFLLYRVIWQRGVRRYSAYGG